MKLLAILAALALEQWRIAGWRRWPEQLYRDYLHSLEVSLSGWGTWVATVAALVPALLVLVIAAIVPFWWLTLILSAFLLYFLMGFRRFSHAVTEILESLQNGDLPAARRVLYEWQGGDSQALSSDEIAQRAIEGGVLAAYRCVFGIVFWFVLLGPTGAAFYWVLSLTAREWADSPPGMEVTPLMAQRAELGRAARWLIYLFDWLPVRFLAFSFAVVGDFEDAIYQWRSQPDEYGLFDNAANENLLLATAAGALGLTWTRRASTIVASASVSAAEMATAESAEGFEAAVPVEPVEPVEKTGERVEDALGEPPVGVPATPAVLPSAIGMVWRALLFWLGLIALMTIAYWA